MLQTYGKNNITIPIKEKAQALKQEYMNYLNKIETDSTIGFLNICIDTDVYMSIYLREYEDEQKEQIKKELIAYSEWEEEDEGTN